MTFVPRLLGALTSAYAVAILVRPELLARPCELTDSNGDPTDGARTLAGVLAVRDISSGLALVFAPEGRALQAAAATRVLFDAGDALAFGLTLPGAEARKKAAAVALGWSTICALGALTTRSKGRR